MLIDQKLKKPDYLAYSKLMEVLISLLKYKYDYINDLQKAIGSFENFEQIILVITRIIFKIS